MYGAMFSQAEIPTEIRKRKSVALFLLLAVGLFANRTLAAESTVILTGKAVDVTTNVGIAGASVDIIDDHKGLAVRTLRTAGDSSFRTDLPVATHFRLLTKAEGYSPVDPVTQFSTGPESGDLSLIVLFTRYAGITGRVFDEDTGNPVPNVRVWPKQTEYMRGKRELLLAAGTATADSDGVFAMKNLPPGDYILELNTQVPAQGDSARVREAYPRTFWPGPGDLQSAVPINLPPGATMNLGDLKLRKRELVALTVKIVGGACVKGQSYDADLMEKAARSRISAATLRVPCGGLAKLPNVDPGEYWLAASAPWQPEQDRETGIISVLISTRDVEATVPISPPVRIRGKVLLDRAESDRDGPKPQLPRGLEVALWLPLPGSGTFISPVRILWGKVSPDGLFEYSAYIPPGEKIEAHVSGQPRNFYVKQIRYNGISAAGAQSSFNLGAPGQGLEIVLSDRAGALSGTVRTEDGGAVANAKVKLTPWPAAVISDYPWNALEAVADSSGNFGFTGLTPGNYRVISVSTALSGGLEEPGVLLRLFDAAETFEIAEGAAMYKNVKPVLAP